MRRYVGVNFDDFTDLDAAFLEIQATIEQKTQSIEAETGLPEDEARQSITALHPMMALQRFLEHGEAAGPPPRGRIEFTREAASYHQMKAMQARLEGKIGEAICHWMYYKAIFRGFFVDSELSRGELSSDMARTAANKAHKENRAMKAQALEHYATNKASYSSKDEAAQAITKLVPVSFATARKWLKGR